MRRAGSRAPRAASGNARASDAERDIPGMPGCEPGGAPRAHESGAAEAAHRAWRAPSAIGPEPGVQRAWTSGPFGATNFIGVQSEIPILDSRKARGRARADAAATRERERAGNAALAAEYEKQRDVLRARRDALRASRPRRRARKGGFLEMAEERYRWEAVRCSSCWMRVVRSWKRRWRGSKCSRIVEAEIELPP